MLTCPKCHAGIPEGMRFCLQCGASLSPPPSPVAPPVGDDPAMPVAAEPPPAPQAAPAPKTNVMARPHPPHQAFPTFPTINLKIAPTPVLSPRAGVVADHPRPSLGDPRIEIDDEALMKTFAREVTQPGAVLCRFCKGPLDLAGDYCEQCGAPVPEAVPPGVLKPDPPPVEPSVSPPEAPAPPPSTPAQAVPPAPPQYSSAAPSPLAEPAALMEPLDPTPTPAPNPPMSPPAPPGNEHRSGFMGRLKGLFKKG